MLDRRAACARAMSVCSVCAFDGSAVRRFPRPSHRAHRSACGSLQRGDDPQSTLHAYAHALDQGRADEAYRYYRTTRGAACRSRPFVAPSKTTRTASGDRPLPRASDRAGPRDGHDHELGRPRASPRPRKRAMAGRRLDDRSLRARHAPSRHRRLRSRDRAAALRPRDALRA
jgi:hypothetical protein